MLLFLSVSSGAFLHATCDPCWASLLGHCNDVVAVLSCVLDHGQKHGTMLKRPCKSQECSWNKGRNKNPSRVSGAEYPSKRKQTLSIIEFALRPARYWEISEHHVDNCWSDIQALSQAKDRAVSNWETQLSLLTVNMHLIVKRKECCLSK